MKTVNRVTGLCGEKGGQSQGYVRGLQFRTWPEETWTLALMETVCDKAEFKRIEKVTIAWKYNDNKGCQRIQAFVRRMTQGQD